MLVAKFLKNNKKAQGAMPMDILEKENDVETGETRDNDNNTERFYDEERQIVQDLELEDACSHSEIPNNEELMNIGEEEELNISAGATGKKKEGRYIAESLPYYLLVKNYMWSLMRTVLPLVTMPHYLLSSWVNKFVTNLFVQYKSNLGMSIHQKHLTICMFASRRSGHLMIIGGIVS